MQRAAGDPEDVCLQWLRENTPPSAVLVVAPPPVETALPESAMEAAVELALAEAQEQNIRGQAVTPFLLGRVSELTGHRSLKANLSLLLNNAQIAAQIAVAFSQAPKTLNI